MVTATVSGRSRLAAAAAGSAGLSQRNQGQLPKLKNARRSFGVWVMIGVPLLLALTLVWQLVSGVLRTEISARDPVAVSRVSLEPDAAGSRVDFVLVDRGGETTTVNGEVRVKLREPDGTLWQTARAVKSSDFTPLPEGSLLAGRVGYSVVVPASDWLRAPRRGGSATVSISVAPSGGAPISTVAEERFP